MDLYTDQLHLKRLLSGEATPAWTPLNKKALEVIDPAFVPGMGALSEDAEGRRRCPLLGCGRWFFSLAHHANQSHRREGGIDRIKRLLDIPRTSPVQARQLRVTKAQMGKARYEKGLFKPRFTRDNQPRIRKGHRPANTFVAFKNWRDRCDAQLAHRVIDFAGELGRSPSSAEFEARFGSTLYAAVFATYGSWDAALAACNLKVRRFGKQTVGDLLPAFSAWYEVHHSLPATTAARRSNKTPALPSVSAVCRIMGCGWPEAMRRIASLLNIYGGRYGLPIEHKPVEAVA